jgi:ATP-dependent helicase HrpB
MIAKALLDQVTREGLSAVPLGEGARAAQPRRLPARTWTPRPGPTCRTRPCSRAPDEWLEPLLAGRSALSQLGDESA